MTQVSAYERLAARFALIATIGECSSMLGWDAAAVMPPGGAAARGDQMAVLAGVSHAMLTAADLAEDLAAAEVPENPWHAANLELMRQTHARATALPADLVEAQARANSACERVWRDARAQADFATVAPYLEEVVSLVRERAARDPGKGGTAPIAAYPGPSMEEVQARLREAEAASRAAFAQDWPAPDG